jgi:predicted phosphodiesterase
MHKIRALFAKSAPRIAFQINSDLHLEVGQQYSSFEIKPAADYLILAGDIGRLIDYDALLGFLRSQTAQFKLVFFVLGNHEFCGTTFEAGLQAAKRLEEEPSLSGRLILLHQGRYDLPDSMITILGCTLWSRIPAESRDIVEAKVKAIQKIEGWTVDKHNERFESDSEWLRSQLQAIQAENSAVKYKKAKRSIVVVSHHAPSLQGTSSPNHIGSPWTCAFASDVLTEGDWAGVNTWLFGHTHYTTQFNKYGVRVVSNQRGYVLPGAKDMEPTALKDASTVFNPRKTLAVPSSSFSG